MSVSVGAPEPRPSPVLFDAVVGQDRAVARLVDAARQPVHAYLFHGPPGSGKRAAARTSGGRLLFAPACPIACRRSR